MDNETLKPIVIDGKETVYLVSDMGHIVNKKTGKILKPWSDKDGYLKINLLGKNYMVHRLVMIAFKPNPNSYPQVNHIDGHKDNNCIDNLCWCSGSQNVRHALRTGLRKGLKGETNPACKYSESEIVEVCELLRTAEESGGSHQKERSLELLD